MNLLLLDRSDLIAENKAEIFGGKVHHLNEILKVNPGNEIRVGLLGGKKGKAVIEKIETEIKHCTELEILCKIAGKSILDRI